MFKGKYTKRSKKAKTTFYTVYTKNPDMLFKRADDFGTMVYRFSYKTIWYKRFKSSVYTLPYKTLNRITGV